jgi:hypothetical protein
MDECASIVFENIALVKFDLKLQRYFCQNQSGSYLLNQSYSILGKRTLIEECNKIRILKYEKKRKSKLPFNYYVKELDILKKK